MGQPSTQIIAVWIRDGATNTDWRLLEEVAYDVLRQRLPADKYSDGKIWEMIEEGLPHIAETLRTEAADCTSDGVPLSFEIDDEPSPYYKAIPSDNELLAKLRRVNPFEVEGICAKILEKLGASSHSTQRTADGGVDFIATNLDIVPSGLGIPAVCRAVVIGQTKRYSETNIITEKSLREFVGAGVWKRHKLRLDSGISPLAPVILAFWTTSNFEPNAKRFARDMGVWYMDGQTLAAYITHLGLAEFVQELPDE